jgi:hypothetical protein
VGTFMDLVLCTVEFVYVAVVVCFARCCIREYVSRVDDSSWDIFRTIGLIACVVWPLIVARAMFDALAAAKRNSLQGAE